MSEVATTTPMLSDAQRADIKSFDDAMALFAQQGMPVTSITEYGDGFQAGADKSDFVNVKFVIVDLKIVPGEKSDYGSDFAVVWIVTVDGRKAILSDGGTGICAQVKTLIERKAELPIMCEKGLTVSEYDYVDDKGKKTPAKTFYFDGM